MLVRYQSFAIFLVYTVLIAGTFYLSGDLAGPATLYDQYLISVDGTVLPTTDEARSAAFYQRALDLQPWRRGVNNELVGLTLPGSNRVFFQHRATTGGSQQAIITIRVRNGLPRLHQAIVSRNNRPPEVITIAGITDQLRKIPSESVTQLLERSGGSEFYVKDPDGNTIVFFQPQRFAVSRYIPCAVESNCQ